MAAIVAVVISNPIQVSAATPDWLSRVDQYRASAALPPVGESGTMDAGDAAHARYMVINQTIGHSEDPSKPGYSAAGNTAASQSDVMVDYVTTTSDVAAVDLWMTGIFHAVGVIDPGLAQAGYGSYRQSGTGEQMGAALNVIGGLGYPPRATSWPVVWPANNATVPLSAYRGGEWPDPLSACPGYMTPTGLPIIVQFGPQGPPAVSAFSLTHQGVSVAVCEFDGTNYSSSDSAQQQDGRAVLAARNALALLPQAPLVVGGSYAVSLTSRGRTYTWSFTVDPSSLPTAGTPPAGSMPGSVPSGTRPAPPVVAPRPAPPAPRPAAPAAGASSTASSAGTGAASVTSPSPPAPPPAKAPAPGDELALSRPHPPLHPVGVPAATDASRWLDNPGTLFRVLALVAVAIAITIALVRRRRRAQR